MARIGRNRPLARSGCEGKRERENWLPLMSLAPLRQPLVLPIIHRLRLRLLDGGPLIFHSCGLLNRLGCHLG